MRQTHSAISSIPLNRMTKHLVNREYFNCTVVEINGGLAKEMGIVEGSKLLSDLPQESCNPAPPLI